MRRDLRASRAQAKKSADRIEAKVDSHREESLRAHRETQDAMSELREEEQMMRAELQETRETIQIISTKLDDISHKLDDASNFFAAHEKVHSTPPSSQL